MRDLLGCCLGTLGLEEPGSRLDARESIAGEAGSPWGKHQPPTGWQAVEPATLLQGRGDGQFAVIQVSKKRTPAKPGKHGATNRAWERVRSRWTQQSLFTREGFCTVNLQ